MLTRPTCLHIPDLYEESMARISWESVEDAEGYELDIHYDEDFEAALIGKTWADMDEAGLTWIQIDAQGLTWAQIEKLPAQGLSWRNIEYHNRSWAEIEQKNLNWSEIKRLPVRFTVYKGRGEKTPAPDQGLTWQNIDSTGLTWAQMEARGWSWQDFELQPSVGLNWAQIDSENLTWIQIEARGWTWQEFEDQAPYGLTWGSLDGPHLTWTEFEELGLTWQQLENLPADSKTHLAHTVELPVYKKKVILRVRAFSGDDYSEYLTSSLRNTLPRSLAKYKPPCIHVLTLYEGESAGIVWSDLYGASGYVLERKLGSKDFVGAYNGPGKSATHPSGRTVPKDYWYTPDGKQHLTFTDQIPYYEKTAQYRIKGYNSTDSSQYQQSAVIPIVPVFYRDDSLHLAAKVGSSYAVQLHAKDIDDFKSIVMALEYPTTMLRLDELGSETSAGKCDFVSKTYKPAIQLVSQKAGQVKFRYTQPLTKGYEWDGLVVSVQFTALQTGNADIKLS
ncbi:cohesin domain-containing protein [Oscillospiraceae bacterium MB08-C2-2]|nr:cohesin domain-containing protein [Oscillospiraceae bacterium MB08-C2-2]